MFELWVFEVRVINDDWSKSKIDRLGDELRNGDFTPQLLSDLESYRASFADAYTLVSDRLTALRYEVTGRPAKSTGALVDKLKRQSSRLSQVQDMAGCRVIVGDIFLQQRAILAIDTYLDGPQIYDRRDKPSHGYRAVHLIADVSGKKVEVQLRTELQHLWAEMSEKISDIVDPGLKYGVGDADALGFLGNVSRAIADVERDEFARIKFFARAEAAGGLGSNKKIKNQVRKAEKNFFYNKERLAGLLRNMQDDLERVRIA